MHRLVLVVSYLALTFSAACGRWNFDALVDEDGMVQAGQIDAAAPLAIDAGVGSGIDASMANVCDDALLCSGFESGLLEEWNPVIRLGTAKLTTPQSIAKAGNRSLEVQVFDSMDEGVVGISFAQAFTSGELWVRAWVYVPTAYGSLSSAGIMYLAEVQSPDQYIDVTVTATGVSVFRERSDSGLDITSWLLSIWLTNGDASNSMWCSALRAILLSTSTRTQWLTPGCKTWKSRAAASRICLWASRVQSRRFPARRSTSTRSLSL